MLKEQVSTAGILEGMNSVDSIDALPISGTVHLVDLNGKTHETHAGYKDTIPVPTPSSDPDDPLNWGQWRKGALLASLVLSSFSTAFGNSVVYSILVPLSKSTGLPLAALNQGTGYLFLLAGWGLLFWQPIGTRYSKRLVYLICLAGSLACNIWAPYSKGNGQWIGRNIIAGIFVSPWEVLPAVTISDVFFQHERGKMMAIYTVTLSIANFLAPILCGFINEYAGWRWVFWLSATLNGVAFVFCFFFMEDTNYVRPLEAISGVIDAPTMTEKYASVTVTDDFHVQGSRNHSNKTFSQRLSCWSPTPGHNPLKRGWQALTYATWPVVFFCGFAYGFSSIWGSMVNGTSSLILGSPPYNFSSSDVGLAYIAPCLGVLIGAAGVGPASDLLMVRRARSRGGIAEAEDRLWFFAVSLLLCPVGLIVYGVGASHHVHWIGLLFGMAMISANANLGATVCLTYLVDSYPAIANEATTSSLLVRNTMVFALNYGVIPWVENLGVQNCFLSAAFIGLTVTATFIPVMIFGKKLRTKTQPKYARICASRSRRQDRRAVQPGVEAFTR